MKALRRGERIFGTVAAVCLAVAGGSALVVASCLDRGSMHRDTAASADMTSADLASRSAPAAPAQTIIVPTPVAPAVTVTVNIPSAAVAGEQADDGARTGTSPTNPFQTGGSNARSQAGQAPALVSPGIVSASPLVAPGLQTSDTQSQRYTSMNNSAYSREGGAAAPDAPVRVEPRQPRSSQGTAAGAPTPTPGPTGNLPVPADFGAGPFRTEWGPNGSGAVTPDPNLGAGAFSNGNTPR